MNDQLLPCPFCGSPDLYQSTNGVDSYFVFCHQCGAEGPVVLSAVLSGKDDAAAAWNRRVTQPATDEPVDIEVPTFSHEGMGCGLEDRGITDRYEAMEYGYNEALEQQWEIINSHGPLFAAPPAAAHEDED